MQREQTAQRFGGAPFFVPPENGIHFFCESRGVLPVFYVTIKTVRVRRMREKQSGSQPENRLCGFPARTRCKALRYGDFT